MSVFVYLAFFVSFLLAVEEGSLLAISLVLGATILLSAVKFVRASKEWDEEQAQRRRRAEQILQSNPSWKQVRQIAVEILGRRCHRCGSTGSLQVHHILPVSEGGTNSLSNLEVLCRPCHEQLHGRRINPFDNFDLDEDDEEQQEEREARYNEHGRFPGPRTDKAMTITQALNRGDTLSFEYKKREATNFEKRTVRPLRIYVEYRRQYLRAYCFKREAERSFRLSRMKNVKRDYQVGPS